MYHPPFLLDSCVAYWPNRAAPENAEPPLLFSFHYEIGKWICLWPDTGFVLTVYYIKLLTGFLVIFLLWLNESVALCYITLCLCDSTLLCVYAFICLFFCVPILLRTYAFAYLCFCVPTFLFTYTFMYLCFCLLMLLCTYTFVYLCFWYLCFCSPILLYSCAFVFLYFFISLYFCASVHK